MTNRSDLSISELGEYAGFSLEEKRFIARSILVSKLVASPEGMSSSAKVYLRRDVGLDQKDEHHIFQQAKKYQEYIPLIKALLPTTPHVGDNNELKNKLRELMLSDLISSQESVGSFSVMRFLYERLFGASVRSFLAAAFCGAAADMLLTPEYRKGLLQSLSEQAATAPGWSDLEPTFFPEWMDEGEEVN